MRFRLRLLILLVVMMASPAWAQASGLAWQGWGLRLGVADDPDQVVGGVQFDLGEIADDWHVMPDIELGVGDDHIILAATAPVHYRFDVNANVTPYAGGGLTVAFIDRDLPAGSMADDTEFEVAVKAIGGVMWPLKSGRTFSLELDLVFGDVHDIEILAGWSF